MYLWYVLQFINNDCLAFFTIKMYTFYSLRKKNNQYMCEGKGIWKHAGFVQKDKERKWWEGNF